jgi:multiple sugar transport system substrate-binding protein
MACAPAACCGKLTGEADARCRSMERTLIRVVRALLIAVVALVAGYLLLVVRPRGLERKDGRVVVTYWEKWSGDDAADMYKIVEDFNNTVGKEKGIYVQYLSMSSVDQKTLIATAAGIPPDVAGLWNNQVAQFAEANALEPLDDLASAHGIRAEEFKPVLWDGCRYGGRLWALVSSCGSQALLYNKRMFAEKAKELRKAGLDPSRAPRTLDELDRYAAVLDEYETLPGGFRRVKRCGFLPNEPGWYIVYMGYWFGAQIYDPVADRIELTDPRMVKCMQWIQSYSKRIGKDSMSEFRSGFGNWTSTQNPFIAGTVAMEMQGPWMVSTFEKFQPQMNHWRIPASEDRKLSAMQRRDNCEWGAAPFPSAVAGMNDVTYANFDVLMIPKGAKHKREAFEFIAFVNSQAETEKLNLLDGQDSPRRAVSRRFLDAHPNPYIGVFEREMASPHAYGVPPCPIWPEVASELNNAIQRVTLLEATPQEALAEAQRRVEARYAEYRERRRARQGSRE